MKSRLACSRVAQFNSYKPFLTSVPGAPHNGSSRLSRSLVSLDPRTGHFKKGTPFCLRIRVEWGSFRVETLTIVRVTRPTQRRIVPSGAPTWHTGVGLCRVLATNGPATHAGGAR